MTLSTILKFSSDRSYRFLVAFISVYLTFLKKIITIVNGNQKLAFLKGNTEYSGTDSLETVL